MEDSDLAKALDRALRIIEDQSKKIEELEKKLAERNPLEELFKNIKDFPKIEPSPNPFVPFKPEVPSPWTPYYPLRDLWWQVTS